MKRLVLAALLMTAPGAAWGAEMPAAVASRAAQTPAEEAAPAMGALDTVEREELRGSDPAVRGAGEAESALLVAGVAILLIFLFIA